LLIQVSTLFYIANQGKNSNIVNQGKKKLFDIVDQGKTLCLTLLIHVKNSI